MTVNVTSLVRLDATLTAAADIGSPTYSPSTVYQSTFTDGTGLNQVNRLFTDRRTIAASGTDDLDLAGALEDALGGEFVLARVKGLLVAASSSNTNNVVVGGDDVEWLFGAAGSTVSVRPGGVFLLEAPDATGYAVTAATGDILQVANSGAGSSVVYDVVIFGAAS